MKELEKPPFVVARTTIATFLANRQFAAGCYALTGYHSDLLFRLGVATGFPTPLSLFNQSTVFLHHMSEP